MRRRDLLACGGLAALTWMLGVTPVRAASPYRAVLFDAFVVFDPRPIWQRAETMFPRQGAALANAWRTRQFEYTWLRSTMQRYADFWTVTRDALDVAAQQVGVDMSNAQRDALMDGYRTLTAWPDAIAGLRALKSRGMRLAFLSNFTPAMLSQASHSAGVADLFEQAISTDRALTYKPDPLAYALGPSVLGLEKRDMVFAAFAGWDAVGACTFGYPTCWVNRTGAPLEHLGAKPDKTTSDFDGLVAFVG
jgi:2-haloacid dehalogenase